MEIKEQKPRSGLRIQTGTDPYSNEVKKVEAEKERVAREEAERNEPNPDEAAEIEEFFAEQNRDPEQERKVFFAEQEKTFTPVAEKSKIDPNFESKHTRLAEEEGEVARAMADIEKAGRPRKEYLDPKKSKAQEPELRPELPRQQWPMGPKKKGFLHRMKRGVSIATAIGAFFGGIKGGDEYHPESDAEAKTAELKKNSERTIASDSMLKVDRKKEAKRRKKKPAAEKSPEIEPQEPPPPKPEEKKAELASSQNKAPRTEEGVTEKELETTASYIFESGDGFYDAARALQDNFKVKSLYSKHPEWKKLSKKKALEQWRVEQGAENGHGVTWYKNIPMAGAKVDLSFDSNGYPNLKLIMDEKVRPLDQRVERKWPAKQKAAAKSKTGFWKKLFGRK